MILKLNNCQVLLQEQRIDGKKRKNKWVWIRGCSLTRLKYAFSLSGFIPQGHSSYTETAVTPALYLHVISLSEIVENQGWFEYLNCLLSGNWRPVNSLPFCRSIYFLKPLFGISGAQCQAAPSAVSHPSVEYPNFLRREPSSCCLPTAAPEELWPGLSGIKSCQQQL